MKNKNLAREILDSLGGKDNVVRAAYCMTRLRVNVKDLKLANIERIRELEGVMACQISAGEIQIIVGPIVVDLHNEFCKLGNFDSGGSVDDESDTDMDGPKEKITPKLILEKIFDGLSGSLAPLIPAFIIMGMTNLIIALLGPNLLGLLSKNSDFYRILFIASQTTIYFLPVFIAFAASRKFGSNLLVSLILAGVLLHPEFIEIVNAGKPFSVFGIPMTLVSYSGSVIPMILITWVQSMLEKHIKRILPRSLDIIAIPTITVLIMLPISLTMLAPLGNILGTGINSGMLWLYDIAGPLETTIIGATVMILIATGMAYPIFALALASYFQTGVEYTFIPMAMMAIWAVMGADLGFILRAKTAEQKELGVTCLLAQALGGVSEPSLFGIMFQYVNVLYAIMIGGAAGGLYLGLMNVGLFTFSTSTAMNVISFAGGPASNFLHGAIACAIAFIVSLAIVLVLGIENKKNKAGA